MADTLLIEWEDPTGKVWDLGTGAQGVILGTRQSGLGWSEISHTTTRGDQCLAASTVKRGVHNLSVLVGSGLKGPALYYLRGAWWNTANSPFKDGILRFTRPDGSVRQRRLRLAEAPDTVFTYDPGLGLEAQEEAWVLTGNGPWWDGSVQVAEINSKAFVNGSDTPFFGHNGAGWPLYISSPAYAQDVFLTNDGQGPMWLTWELVGPMTNPYFGVAGGPVLAYNGKIYQGETVIVTTDPERRGVMSLSTNESRYHRVAGVFAPVPGGSRVPLTASAEDMGAGSKIIARGVTKYASAF